MVGDSGPCSDAESFFDAAIEGDGEAAVEYVPYEYDPDLDREAALAEYEMSEQDEEMMEEFDIDFSCEESESLDEDEIDDLGADLGDHEITAAEELRFVTSMSGEFMGEEIEEEHEDTGIVVEIDGDGWYIWED